MNKNRKRKNGVNWLTEVKKKELMNLGLAVSRRLRLSQARVRLSNL